MTNKDSIFRVVDSCEDGEALRPVVDMEISSFATLSDMLYAFERFLLSIGYVFPDNTHLDFISDDESDGREF